MKLTPAMRRAIDTAAAADGTIREAARTTERALVSRGLAVAVYGNVQRTNKFSRVPQTVYGAYLGARLTDAGKALHAGD